MWAKTFAGFFLGFIINVSLMMNLAFILPVERQVVLLIGFIGGFFVWAGIATYFYSVERLAPALKKSVLVLIASAIVNSLFVAGVLK